MSSKDADIFQSNVVSECINIPRKRGRPPKSNVVPECINIPRKRGRPPKSKHIPSQINCSTKQNSHFQFGSTKDDTSSKDLKLFPIFKSQSKLYHSNNIKHIDKTSEFYRVVHHCKQRKVGKHELDNVSNSNQRNVHAIKRKKSKAKKNSKAEFQENKADGLVDHDCVVLDQEKTSCDIEAAKINGFYNCLSTDIDPAIFEVVQYVCLKTEQAVESNDVLLLNDSQLAEDILSRNVTFTKNKLKRKRKAKEEIVPVVDVMSTESSSEISSRRRSLRSRGVRNDLMNYSEIDSSIITLEDQQNVKLLASKSSSNKHTESVKSNINTKECSSKVECNTSEKILKKGENVKNKLKLFPVFTSKKESSGENNINQSLKKRKSSLDETPTVSDVSNSVRKPNKNIHYKNKKIRNELSVGESDKRVPNEIISEIHEDKSFEDKVIIILDTTTKIKTVDEECKIESIKAEKNSQARFAKKSDVESICFPVLSHLSMCNELLPETVNKFCINSEGLDYDVTLPVWNVLQGFIDADSTKLIQCKLDKPNMGNKLVKELSTATLNSNIDENEKSMLWTDSVQNTAMKEKRNEAVVNEVRSWLLQWKEKFCKNSERKKSYSDSDSFSSDSDSDDDFVSNSVIIYGAPGSGKTNLVFSLANELGFTVLEVNASSNRNGRNLSHQLKEALESYHMESIKIEDSFNNITLETKQKDKKHNTSDTKELSTSTSKSINSFFEPGSKSKCKTKEKKKQSIANFFQSGVSDKKDAKSNQMNASQKGDKNKKSQFSKKVAKNTEVDTTEILKSDKTLYRISNLTIILFDDVDIVFEEDEGFWSTVKGFLKISKKPVIFTVGRNLTIVKTLLNSDIRVFNMEPLSKEFALTTVKGFCKKFSRENTSINLELLTFHNLNDLRRNILGAQFWTQNFKPMNEKISVLKYFVENKFVHVNSFLVGDVNFSADQVSELLFHSVPNYFLNAFSQYQSLGYDVLYSNLFYILNILDSMKYKNTWKTLTIQKSGNSVKNFSDSQMWEEACEIFKQKKRALKSGACSEELNLFANVVSDFSFADALKGLASNKFQWISVSERIKLWTDGLPICCDHISWLHEDILQLVSLIDIYSLRLIKNNTFFKSESNNNSNLNLDHPYALLDQDYACCTKDDLKCISAALPPSQYLNREALAVDYLSMIKIMCQDEESRQLNSGKRSGRFLHYFDSISFLLDKKTF